MKEYTVDGRTYRLAGGLTDFQLGLYMHLVDWKRAHLTEECGCHKHEGRLIPYDSMLPAELKEELQPLYRPIVGRVRTHQQRFPFKLHKFAGHMASSQMACINLFVPLLQHPEVAECAVVGDWWPGAGVALDPTTVAPEMRRRRTKTSSHILPA